MMENHTPGPWAYHNSGLVDCVYGKDATGADVRIAELIAPPTSANARLVAAAPDMLAMLYALLPYIETAELDELYKPGAVAKVTRRLKDVIIQAGGEAA